MSNSNSSSIRINIHEAKSTLSAIAAKIVTDGSTYILCKNGEPIAEIKPYQEKSIKISELKPHPKLGKIKFFSNPGLPAEEDEWPLKFR